MKNVIAREDESMNHDRLKALAAVITILIFAGAANAQTEYQGVTSATPKKTAGDSSKVIQPELRRTADIATIEKAIHRCIGWAKNKDLRLLYGIIADDSTYLEVDPGVEIISGINQFRKNEAFWMHPDFKAVRYDIRDLKINLSRSGDVAWFYCVLDDVNEWKGKPASWMNTRWTGVLEKRDEVWRMVQMHFSFAKE
jgi:ketosteroid isomerase-like protein